MQGEQSVDKALVRLLKKDAAISFETVEAYSKESIPAHEAVSEVSIDSVDLSSYDGLVQRGED